jgi:Tfp pilus assembly protein FimT
MVELMVVITVLAILVGLAAVNWVAFARYQSLRADAHAFQKDLMALKARAVAEGDTIKINPAGNSYEVWIQSPPEESGGSKPSPVKAKTVSLNVTTISGKNGWASGITIDPNNLDAFKEGSVEIGNDNNQFFRIIKKSGNIKLEIEHKKGNGQWKKI